MRHLDVGLRLTAIARPCGARRAAALVLALVAGAASLAVDAVPVRDERPLAAGQTFAVRVEAGDVAVVPGAPGVVVADADLAPGQGLRWREAFGRLTLVLDDRDRLAPRGVSLRVAVPPESSLVLHLGDASLRLEGIGGERLRVRGGRGDVRLSTSAAEVDVETGAGAIEIAMRGGRLRSASLGGAQRLVVDAPTTTVDRATLDADLESLSGDLSIRLPSGAAFDLRLAQASGNVRLPADARAMPDGTISVGDKGVQLRLETFSGNIDVESTPVR